MTKTDLINAIKAIDPNAKTWGLDKDELQALLTELQAKATNQEQGQAAAEGTPADPAANVPRETKPEDLIKNDVAPAELTPAFYVVAEGRAITSKRGILAAGEAVEARDFVGGEETLNSLLERGLVE